LKAASLALLQVQVIDALYRSFTVSITNEKVKPRKKHKLQNALVIICFHHEMK